MSRILVTHPGRFGDCIWSMATARVISETIGSRVDFMLSKQYGSLEELIALQSYINRCFVAEDWEIREEAPITPRIPPHLLSDYRLVVHLGYPGWPSGPTLPESIWKIAEEQVPGLKALELERPWIEVEKYTSVWQVVFGFSDEHFETKVGLVELLSKADLHLARAATYAPASRWDNEWCKGVKCNWLELAGMIASAKLFVGCLSAPWVLANAVGQRSVIVEPQEMRHNPVFWLESPRNTLVRGLDGKPTVDARHALYEVKLALEGK